MSVIKLKKYGRNLSGRPLGITTFSIIIKEHSAPYEIDLDGVTSIGSSFADEVIAKLAEKNDGKIKIYNSSRVIDKCLREVSRDKGFDLIYEEKCGD